MDVRRDKLETAQKGGIDGGESESVTVRKQGKESSAHG